MPCNCGSLFRSSGADRYSVNVFILLSALSLYLARVNLCFTRSLQWRHNGHDGVWNHQPHDCLLNRLFRRKWKKTSKLRVTGLCARNSPVTGEFPAQMASYAEKVSIWWRLHVEWWPRCLTPKSVTRPQWVETPGRTIISMSSVVVSK